MSERLGRLERVSGIREVLPREATDFTPWLSRPESLSILSEALGMGPDGLELEASEMGVGRYYADIVCRDTGTADGARVLIENQFGASDHDHLGKLLTYASGLKARTVVLIGEKIREEHRAALDWLNDITGEEHNFFACEVELWRIGDSLPAPRFNVVVQPNEWTRDIQHNLPGDAAPSELKLTYLRYWEALNAMLEGATHPIRLRKPAAKHWMDCGLGKANAVLRIEISERENRIKIGIYLQGEPAKSWFAVLAAQRPDIENQIGEALDWNPLPDRQSSWIGLTLQDANPTNDADWPRQHGWLEKGLRRLHGTFSPRVKQLSERSVA